jgi:uncharacterized protein (DUF1015 family)
MAEVRPFKGVYFDTSKVDIGKVVTQPWDVITPEIQQGYYDSDPHNIVRIIRAKDMPGDNEAENKFTRAGRFFHDWMAEGVFVRDGVDSLYLYRQEFQLGKSQFTRRGLITEVKLEDYESKVVLPHEHTFPSHNADRLHLMRETKANFGQIFVLYPDAEMTIPTFLAQYESSPAVMSVKVNGITHTVFRISDSEGIRFLVEELKEKQLFIADGHHRYQTALNYRDEMFPKLSEEGRREVSHRMMTLVSMDDPSVTILPTHRVVQQVPGFDEQQMLKQLNELFDVQRFDSETPDLQAMLRRLGEFSSATTAFVVCFPGGRFLLARLKGDKTAMGLLAEQVHPAVRELDITILHSLILEGMLSLSAERQRSGEHILYYRDPAEAVKMVQERKAQAAFLLNPTRVHQVRDVALAGQVMPQKSTDFYPKMLTGLVIRKLDI